MSRYFIQIKGEKVEETLHAYRGFDNGDDCVADARNIEYLNPKEVKQLWRIVRVKADAGTYKIVSVHKLKGKK